MLTWRFAIQLNRSLVELVGLVIEKTEVAHLKSFPCIVVKKTSQVTCGDQILVLSGVVVPIVDVECLKKCLAMVKVGLSRFQKPIGKLASVYHRECSGRQENYHLEQNYASRQT